MPWLDVIHTLAWVIREQWSSEAWDGQIWTNKEPSRSSLVCWRASWEVTWSQHLCNSVLHGPGRGFLSLGEVRWFQYWLPILILPETCDSSPRISVSYASDVDSSRQLVHHWDVCKKKGQILMILRGWFWFSSCTVRLPFVIQFEIPWQLVAGFRDAW